MEEQSSEEKELKDNVQQLSPSPSRGDRLDQLSAKYPYLTAYIGFILMSILAGIIAGIVFIVPQMIYSTIRGQQMFSPWTPTFQAVLQVILAFYSFKYVVNKHILPNVTK
ncbi:MAG: hypothetical protein HYZ25_15390 [Chloroflexi bacterium]|nr:hypothetical protein [Chloroflexota bacterium]